MIKLSEHEQDKAYSKRRNQIIKNGTQRSINKCLKPITIQDAYSRTHNWATKRYEVVPCGKCYACLRRKALQWQFRLETEWKHHKYSAFCALTYADEFLPLSETETLYGFQGKLVKEHLEKFLKRMKDFVRRRFDSEIRYYAIGEYGTSDDATHRPHYHFLYFTDCKEFNDNAIYYLMKLWPYGRVDVGYCNSRSIGYIVHDMMKEFDTSKKRHNFINGMYVPKWCEMMNIPPPFVVATRLPFLGYQYLEIGRNFHMSDPFNNRYVTLESGVKVALPKIYANKYWPPRKARHNDWLENYRRIEEEDELCYEEIERIADSFTTGNREQRYQRALRIYLERFDPERVANIAFYTNQAKN